MATKRAVCRLSCGVGSTGRSLMVKFAVEKWSRLRMRKKFAMPMITLCAQYSASSEVRLQCRVRASTSAMALAATSDHTELSLKFSLSQARGRSDVAEVAMPAFARGEARGAGGAVDFESGKAVVPLLAHRLAERQRLLHVGRAPVGAHAGLRKARDLVRHGLGELARLALGHDVLAGTDAQRLVRRHLAPGEDDLHRASHADDARQAHGAAVDQRHAPAPAIDAEVRRFLHHAQVAPERELEAAGDRGTRDRGDHRLVELEARRPERPARDGFAIVERIVDLVELLRVLHHRRAILEVPAGAERAALA